MLNLLPLHFVFFTLLVKSINNQIYSFTRENLSGYVGVFLSTQTDLEF